MKNIKYLIFTFIIMFIGVFNVFANTYKSIDMDIIIDTSGNLHVKEVWDVKTNKNTEIFIPKYNLGNITISNFKVRDENRTYIKNDNWNINDSFKNKAYKYGINKTENGPELCFGISEYGSKKYTIEYTLNNAIFLTNDSQVLYFELINKSESGFESFNIDINGPLFFEKTLDVWGFGYEGLAYVDGGKILLNDYGNSLDRDEYVVLLVKFPLNTFNIEESNKYDEYETFNDVLFVAEEDSYVYDDPEENYNVLETDSSGGLAILLVLLASTVIGILITIFKISLNMPTQTYLFGESGKKIDEDEAPYFRDIPCNKDIFLAYFIIILYDLNDKKSDFFGAIILKWLKESKISIITQKINTTSGEKSFIDIDLKNYKLSNIKVEDDLYKIFRNAAEDGILQEREFGKYLTKKKVTIVNWFKEVEKYSRNIFKERKLVTEKKDTEQFVIDDAMKDQAIKLYGLYRYLKDFSLIHEKKPIEVKLWKDYLIFAQLFGIADEVAKQFADIYPEIAQEMSTTDFKLCKNNDYSKFSDYVLSTVEMSSGPRGLKDNSYTSTNGYSAGGGGRSFGGGGGGSFGGGGRSGSR